MNNHNNAGTRSIECKWYQLDTTIDVNSIYIVRYYEFDSIRSIISDKQRNQLRIRDEHAFRI